MPLDEMLPQIDNRRYDDIVAEIRTRIPRYTPEWKPVWSDLNDNDVGITLVQVFAWLSEMLLYRMAQVPELNYVKFLQLLGIELMPAEPARTEISFPVKENSTQPSVIIPARTQVSGQAESGGPPLVFETERAITALTARLAAVVVFDGYSYRSVTVENDNPEQSFQPFGSRARPESALMLGFAYPAGSLLTSFPQVEVDLAAFSAAASKPASAVACGGPLAFRSAELRWEYWDKKNWLALDLLRDDTLALARTGHVRLRVPIGSVLAADTMPGAEGQFFWLRARLLSTQYERPPSLLAIRANTVEAVQAETIQDEVLGGSNGRRDQIFKLENAPVLAGTLRLEVDEGDGYHPWQEVPDFFGSKPGDAHFVLNRTTGEVIFGDGLNGRIPVGNVNNVSANVIARVYRFGGGRRGNLPAGAVKTLVTPVAGVDEAKVGNLFPADSGRDEETLDEARKRAPRSLKSRNRAVTAEDFELLAAQAGNIRRARALPLHHPSFPGVQVPGVVSVIVVPDSDEPAPMPSDGTLRTVCACLDSHRLLTSEVYVLPPTYQEVQVRAEVVVEDRFDLAEVKQAIEQRLLSYFHPLKGGESGQGWPFGETIYYSRAYQRVFSTPGVRSINRLTILLDGEEAQECRDVPLKPGALAYSTRHEVSVMYTAEG